MLEWCPPYGDSLQCNWWRSGDYINCRGDDLTVYMLIFEPACFDVTGSHNQHVVADVGLCFC